MSGRATALFTRSTHMASAIQPFNFIAYPFSMPRTSFARYLLLLFIAAGRYLPSSKRCLTRRSPRGRNPTRPPSANSPARTTSSGFFPTTAQRRTAPTSNPSLLVKNSRSLLTIPLIHLHFLSPASSPVSPKRGASIAVSATAHPRPSSTTPLHSPTRRSAT